jgi:hypothetical protein
MITTTMALSIILFQQKSSSTWIDVRMPVIQSLPAEILDTPALAEYRLTENGTSPAEMAGPLRYSFLTKQDTTSLSGSETSLHALVCLHCLQKQSNSIWFSSSCTGKMII